MTPEKGDNRLCIELMLTAIVLTLSVIIYEASWFNNLFLPIVNTTTDQITLE